MVKSIYKGLAEVGTLYKGDIRIYKTSNVPKVVTPYASYDEIVDTSISRNIFNTFYRDRRVDFIVSSKELSVLGLKQGSSILGMSFKNQKVDNMDKATNFKIALKHTTQTVAPSVVDSYYTFQEVYSTSIVSDFIENTHKMFDFSNPFIWDGSSNLMIAVLTDGSDTYGNSSTNFSFVRNNVELENYTISFYAIKNGIYPFETGSRSLQRYIPSIQLNVLGLGLQKGDLSVFIAQSEAIFANKTAYSIDSVAALQEAYNEAVLLFNDESVSQEKIDKDTERFMSVYAELVSFDELNRLINWIPAGHPQNMYSIDSYKLLSEPILAAKASMAVADVSQSVIDAHQAAIELVIANLVSFVELKALIADSKLIYPSAMYTADSYLALSEALTAAEQSMAVTNVTKSTIASHLTLIQTAINGLVKLPFAGGILTATPTEIVADGLMGHWDVGGRTNETDSTTTLPDISGNGWDMNIVGVNGTSTSGFLGGYGLKLDGVNDYLHTKETRLASGASITFDSVLTLPKEVVHKIIFGDTPDSSSNYFRNQYQSYNNYSWTDLYTYVSNGGNASYEIYKTQSNYSLPSKTISITTVLEFVGTNLTSKHYVNGLLIAEGSTSLPGGQQNYFDHNWYFKPLGDQYSYSSGTLYSSRMYNKALTPEEITQNYNYEKTRWGLS